MYQMLRHLLDAVLNTTLDLSSENPEFISDTRNIFDDSTQQQSDKKKISCVSGRLS
jgi:hypothetical protein